MKQFAFLAALGLIAPAQAQSQPSPFFAAFQRFCADPALSPQTIRLAAEAAGGRLIGRPGSTDVPQPMYVAGWNVAVQGQGFLVTAGGVRAPYGMNKVQDSVSCSIMGDDSDGAARAELDHWMGISPSISGPLSVTYDFEWNGQKHAPPPDGPAFRAESEAGKVWELTILGSGKHTNVTLRHVLKPTPKL